MSVKGLRRNRHLFTAERGEEFVTFAVWSDERHKLFILQHVKYVCGEPHFRFVFGLAGQTEHFSDGFRDVYERYPGSMLNRLTDAFPEHSLCPCA